MRGELRPLSRVRLTAEKTRTFHGPTQDPSSALFSDEALAHASLSGTKRNFRCTGSDRGGRLGAAWVLVSLVALGGWDVV